MTSQFPNLEQVAVNLGSQSYTVHIGGGLLERVGEFLSPFLARPKIVVVTDENVSAAHGRRLADGLAKADIQSSFITLRPGEPSKSFQQLESLLGQLLDLEVERNDLIVAFGGGVIGDLAGFAASILRRGCRFAQIPTSLLAQVDSSVGGKTAINISQGKNLVGAFHQPAIVIADLDVLSTLPDREMRAGYAEIAKYGAIMDEAFFSWLERNGRSVLDRDHAALTHAVKTSVAKKAEIVQADEREKGDRALLNLGHTFGHALEAAFGYSDKLLHGEAVSIGMSLAFEFSAEQQLCSRESAARVKTHLASVGLPISIDGLNEKGSFNASQLIAHMMQDKKNTGGALTLILARSVGEAFVSPKASVEQVEDFLKRKIRP